MNEKKIELIILQDKIVVTKRRGGTDKKGRNTSHVKQRLESVINVTRAII